MCRQKLPKSIRGFSAENKRGRNKIVQARKENWDNKLQNKSFIKWRDIEVEIDALGNNIYIEGCIGRTLVTYK